MKARVLFCRSALPRLAAVVVSIMLLSAPLVAQQPPDDGFVAVTPGELAAESLPAAPFIYGAYATAWVVILGYVFVLWRKLVRVEQELRDVHRELGADRSE